MRTLALAAIAALSLGGVAAAQTTTASHMTPVAKPAPASTMAVTPKTAATTKATTTTATTMTTDKASLSKSCSDQANGKNLHGKERKKFRNACKHGKV